MEKESKEIQNIIFVQKELLELTEDNLMQMWKNFQELGFYDSSHGVTFLIHEILNVISIRWNKVKTYAKFIQTIYSMRNQNPFLSLIPSIIKIPPNDIIMTRFNKELIKLDVLPLDNVFEALPKSINDTPFSIQDWFSFIFFCDIIKEKHEGYYSEVYQYIDKAIKTDDKDFYSSIKNQAVNRIIFNFPTYAADNFAHLQTLFDTGWTDDTLGYHLIIDDLNFLQDASLEEDFSFDLVINDHNELSKYNIFALKYLKDASLIEFCGFYGSINCFKFLAMNKAKTTIESAKFFLSGGCMEIIQYAKQLNIDLSHATERAIFFKHNEIVNWIFLNYQQKQKDKNKCFAAAIT